MKKWVAIILPIFLVVTIIGMLIFVFSGDLTKEFPIEGTWKVLASHQGSVLKHYDSTYYVFEDDNTYTQYVGGEVKHEGEYELKFEELKLDGADKGFYLKSLTENILQLYQQDLANGDKYISLMKTDSTTDVVVDKNLVIGDWLVTCHSDNNQINEKIVFDENNLSFYRNDFEIPAVVSSYGWDGVDLVADKLQIKMKIHDLNEKYFIFVEEKSCLVWELKAITE